MTKAADRAGKAILAVFSDTSVSLEETADLLRDLRDDIDMKLGCLEADMKLATRSAGQ